MNAVKLFRAEKHLLAPRKPERDSAGAFHDSVHLTAAAAYKAAVSETYFTSISQHSDKFEEPAGWHDQVSLEPSVVSDSHRKLRLKLRLPAFIEQILTDRGVACPRTAGKPTSYRLPRNCVCCWRSNFVVISGRS